MRLIRICYKIYRIIFYRITSNYLLHITRNEALYQIDYRFMARLRLYLYVVDHQQRLSSKRYYHHFLSTSYVPSHFTSFFPRIYCNHRKPHILLITINSASSSFNFPSALKDGMLVNRTWSHKIATMDFIIDLGILNWLFNMTLPDLAIQVLLKVSKNQLKI